MAIYFNEYKLSFILFQFFNQDNDDLSCVLADPIILNLVLDENDVNYLVEVLKVILINQSSFVNDMILYHELTCLENLLILFLIYLLIIYICFNYHYQFKLISVIIIKGKKTNNIN